MKRSVNLTIDGLKADGSQEMTILDAAKNLGIEIPTLCDAEGLSPSGNCRICVVEVEGSRTLVGACHTPISEGMVVHTRSQKVLDARRSTVELLLTAHTGPCVTDSEARECTLHKLAACLEVGSPRFRVRKPRFYSAEEGPYVLRDMSRCILCRKCVRACSEIAGQNVLGIAYRSFRSKVVAGFDVPLNTEVCKDCGICIEYCPTSALMWPEGMKRREGSAGKGAAKGGPAGSTDVKLLDLLKARQRTEGCLSAASLSQIAGSLGIAESEVYGVATFYGFLSTKLRGRNVIRICKSLPCYLKNGPMIIESVAKAIGIGPDETTADGTFSLELTSCIGACDQAPAMLVNDKVYGGLTPAKIADILKDPLFQAPSSL